MKTRIETALANAIARAEAGAPPKLASALRYAVFPGGARVRPRLCLAVAAACGDDNPALSDAMGAAIELLHCASLVHDDLPCFDDAATLRHFINVFCARCMGTGFPWGILPKSYSVSFSTSSFSSVVGAGPPITVVGLTWALAAVARKQTPISVKILFIMMNAAD